MVTFDAGYGEDPFRSLCQSAPGAAVYPADRFRVEWGSILHRGRLDGTARVLVVGQDPAAHENVARRVLCGVAGHRVQGFLAKLGVDRSYVMMNAFLYSLYGTAAPTPSQAQLADRYDWIDAILTGSPVEVVATFGAVAGKVWAGYLTDRAPAAPPCPSGQSSIQQVVPLRHLIESGCCDDHLNPPLAPSVARRCSRTLPLMGRAANAEGQRTVP